MIVEVASPSWLFVVAELRVSSRLEIPSKSRSQRGVEEGVLKLISSLEAKHMTIYLEWLFALGIAIRLIEPYSTLGEQCAISVCYMSHVVRTMRAGYLATMTIDDETNASGKPNSTSPPRSREILGSPSSRAL